MMLQVAALRRPTPTAPNQHHVVRASPPAPKLHWAEQPSTPSGPSWTIQQPDVIAGPMGTPATAATSAAPAQPPAPGGPAPQGPAATTTPLRRTAPTETARVLARAQPSTTKTMRQTPPAPSPEGLQLASAEPAVPASITTASPLAAVSPVELTQQGDAESAGALVTSEAGATATMNEPLELNHDFFLSHFQASGGDQVCRRLAPAHGVQDATRITLIYAAGTC